MKKILSISCGILALFAISCNKAVTDVPATPAAGEKITISATLNDIQTKVSFGVGYDANNKPTGTVALAWADGDAIRVYDHSDRTKYEDFTLDAASVGQKKGIFTGTAITASAYDVEVINAAFDYASQTQPADGETTGLKYMASASNIASYDSIDFTDCSSVLAITAKLPSTEVAAAIKSVEIAASEAIFNGGKTLAITFDAAGDAGADGILHFFATLPSGGQAIAAGTSLLVRFNAPGTAHTVYTRYIELPADSFSDGAFNAISINASKSDKHAGLTSCDGTSEAKAYLIGDKYQLQAMHDLMPDDKTTYFKLIDDIDMADETWVALNAEGVYPKGINFEGNNKTISNLTVQTGAYPSFIGVINGSVKNVTFEKATVPGGSNCAGVLAGYIGSAAASVSGTCSGITVNNSTVTGSKRGLGGMAGIISKLSAPVSDCHVNNTTVTSTADRVGGIAGQVEKTFELINCSTDGVTIKGTVNMGSLVGVLYGNATNCTTTGGTVTSTNTTSNADIALGGLAGYFENGVISKCSASVNISQATNGRDIGGLVGKMLAGTIENSCASGNVKGLQRNVGGLVGLVSLSAGNAVIRNSYCTGNVDANAYCGGLIGYHEKGNLTVTNCYCTGAVNGTGFACGGLVDIVGAAAFNMSKSAAWGPSVTAASTGAANWSSAAVVGVTFPTCTLTDNYRNPAMSVTAYWVPAAGFSHLDVSASHPLTDSTGAEMTDVSTSNNASNPHYPQYPYHGKVEAGKTLSQLASTTLGWDSAIWDFSGELPELK